MINHQQPIVDLADANINQSAHRSSCVAAAEAIDHIRFDSLKLKEIKKNVWEWHIESLNWSRDVRAFNCQSAVKIQEYKRSWISLTQTVYFLILVQQVLHLDYSWSSEFGKIHRYSKRLRTVKPRNKGMEASLMSSPYGSLVDRFDWRLRCYKRPSRLCSQFYSHCLRLYLLFKLSGLPIQVKSKRSDSIPWSMNDARILLKECTMCLINCQLPDRNKNLLGI